MRERPYLICFVAVALLLYSMCSLASVAWKLEAAEKDFRQLEEEYAAVKSEQEMLTAQLENGLDDSQIEEIARERLGLVMPGEKIFYFSYR